MASSESVRAVDLRRGGRRVAGESLTTSRRRLAVAGSFLAGLLLSSFVAATPAAAWTWGYESGLRYQDPYTPATRVTDVATLSDGSVIVVGFMEKDPGDPFTDYQYDWVVARVGNSGILGYTEEWYQQLGSGQEPTADQAERVVADVDDNVFVGGQMWDTSGAVYRARIVKLDGTTGNVVSSVFFPQPASSFSDHYIRDLAVDSAGNLIVALGSSSGLFQIVKLDGNDLTQTLWTYTESSSTSGESFDVGVNGNDDVLVAGSLDVGGGTLRAVVAKLDGSAGGELWKNDTLSVGGRVWHGPSCPTPLQAPSVPDCGSAAATSLLVTGNGDAVVLAQQADGTSSLVVRLAENDGSVVWQRPVSDFLPRSIATDYATGVYAAGAAGATHDQFGVAAIDLGSGSLSWSQTYGAGYPKDIDVTGDGKPAATGSIQDVYGDYRMTVVAAAAVDGTEVWRTTDTYGVEGHGLCVAQTSDGQLAAGGVEVGATCPGCPGNPTAYRLSYLSAWRLLAADGSLTECGNGSVEQGEECDPGAPVAGDCCTATCQLEAADTPCDDGLACSTVDQCDSAGQCQPISGDCCGDGHTQVTLGEQCDLPGASCCINCQLDVGASCDYGTSGNPYYLGPGQHPACNPPRCGYGGGCFDGPSICDCCSAHVGHGCSDTTCQDCVSNYAYSCYNQNWVGYCAQIAYSPSQCDSYCNCPAPVCGNHVVEPGEQCDDGNTTSGDCCSSTCQTEGSCAVCGNGVINFPGEDCDDGNTVNGDCCDSTCHVEAACCGNGVVNAGELCDDGNTVSGDCCSSTCVPENPCCGDYLIGGSEECDDGNATSGDCCSSTCTFESECAEHFKSYKAKTTKGTTKFSPEQVTLQDEFGTYTIAISKPAALATPVDVDGGGTVDDTLHMECYKTKDVASSQPPPAYISVWTEGMTSYGTLSVGKPASLCLPTAKNGVATDLGADRFRCYKAKLAGPRVDSSTVTLADQFETKSTLVGLATLFCAPAQQTLGAVEQPRRHLLCHKIKDAKSPPQPKLTPQSVTTENSFGDESLTASKSSLLCVPALLFQ